MSHPNLDTTKSQDGSRAFCLTEIDTFIKELVERYRDDDVFALEATHQMAYRRLMDGLWLRRQRLSGARAAAQQAARQITDHEDSLNLTAR